MVRLRLKRMGRTHRPFYRLNAVDKRTQRDGKIIENLGWYDPIAKDASKQVELKVDRIKHWLSVGAQPSETVADLLAKHDIIDAEKRRAGRMARVKGKIAKLETEKAAAEAQANAEAEAKAKADAEAAATAAKEAEAAESAEGEGGES